MKIRFVLTIFSFLIVSTHILGSIPENIEYKHFKGSIGSSKITMDVFYNSDTLFGTYYYDQIGKRLFINGSVFNKKIKALEFDEEWNNTGVFEILIGTNNSLSGKWNDENFSRILDFSADENYNKSCKIELFSMQYSEHLLDNPTFPETIYELMFWLPTSSPNKNSENILITGVKNYFFEYSCTDYQSCINNILLKLEHNTAPADTTEIIQNPWMYAWEFYGGTGVAFNDKNFLVLSYETFEYTGGAHGISDIEYKRYDLETGEELFKYDIIKENKSDELLDLILNQLQEDDLTGYLFSTDEVFVTDNIGFDQYGIIFMYNVYEIAPYVVGPIEVTIPYSKIKSCLKSDFRNRILKN